MYLIYLIPEKIEMFSEVALYGARADNVRFQVLLLVLVFGKEWLLCFLSV